MLSNNNEFNFEEAKECALYYAESTGIRTIVIDNNGKTVFETCPYKNMCNFCKSIGRLVPNKHRCEDVHLYGSYQAERFGGRYVFFSPLGLVHWVSPIITNGKMEGALLAGPVHMVSPEDFLLEDIIKKYNVTARNMIEISRYIRELPVISTKRVNSLSELLYLVSAHLSDMERYRLIKQKETQDQLADISEYIHAIKNSNKIDKIPTYPLDKERELLSAISLGNKPTAQRLLNEILGHIYFSSGSNFNLIKARILEMVVLLSRAALEGGAEVKQIFGLNFRYLNQINEYKTVEELTEWLSEILDRFSDCVFKLSNVKHIDVIYKAIAYIQSNYMRKLSLEEVASHVYLSPSYFSKIFKDEMNMNYNSYLNNIRIEMSKKLLMDINNDIADISCLVGYEDQSYFSKVFKRITGLSPGKYRESRGNIL